MATLWTALSRRAGTPAKVSAAGASLLIVVALPGLAAPVDGADRGFDAPARIVYDRTIDPTTAAVRAALRHGVSDGLFVDEADASAIRALYAARGYVPLWTAEGRLNDRGLAVVQKISDADAEGLDRTDYPVPRPALGVYVAIDRSALGREDVMISQAVAAYARDAYSGRVDPKSISSNFGYDVQRLSAGDTLAMVARSPDPAATLSAFHPPQPEFARLRDKLAELRRKAAADRQTEIPAGGLLKRGTRDPRVVLVRERLGLATDGEASQTYDEGVGAAIKEFQRANRLAVDGIVGRNTLAVLNRGTDDHVATIVANMERWRWMPRYLGSFYVRVNVPDFTVDVYEKDTVVHSTRIVVGTPRNATPIFSDEIEHVVVNPTWNVPASIARNEMLPKMRAGSSLRGYIVYANIRGRFRKVNPRQINWRRVDMRKIAIKQPPGARNALGQVKFMFPNKYAVYLHDTPSKNLFEGDYRAYSHGCMRVMNPWDFAAALLSEQPELPVEQLREKVGGRETRVDLQRPVPVHLTYFTAWVDDAGALQIRDDLYGHDRRVEKAMGH